MKELPYKVAVLVFVRDKDGRYLLIHRAKQPNLGTWSPIGGKLEMTIGESPFECAVREVREESRHEITTGDLHLFAMLSEKSYEDSGHWLLFLFDCKKPIPALPPEISEGEFGFFSREEVDGLNIPDTDRQALWGLYDKYREGFISCRINCALGKIIQIETEQALLPRKE